MDIFIMYPHGRVSDLQRLQMTTVPDDNVHNIALDGTFDDCQNIVKSLFADKDFREKHHLTAVNSINWARIVAQIVYYFYAALQLGAPARTISFCVPTGNFGDIYAGYVAKKMGLPINQLIIATNRNDILARCLDNGIYGIKTVEPSLSPSMDIQISSNFERLLFDLYNRDGEKIREIMEQFQSAKSFTLTPIALSNLRAQFSAAGVSDEDTLQTIRECYAQTGELLDPHTAVGLCAGGRARTDTSSPLVVLATAHPAKFPDAVKKASGIHPALPPHLADLFTRKEKFERLENDINSVKKFIEKNIG